MDEKSFCRARMARFFLVGSIVVFVAGLLFAFTVDTDRGPFCMFLCIMPLCLFMVYVAHTLEEAAQHHPVVVPIRLEQDDAGIDSVEIAF